jgi:hypothetical protein
MLVAPTVTRPTPPAARDAKYARVRSDGRPSGVPYIVSMGDITMRFRTAMAPIRPGASRCSNAATGPQPVAGPAAARRPARRPKKLASPRDRPLA